MSLRVWFIRHAESEANAGGFTSDPAAIPLTTRGVWQAERVAQAFGSAPSLIVVSSFLRSRQTAQPTAARFPSVRVVEWPVHEFTYLAPARCQNMTPADRRPLVEDYWLRNNPFYVDGPGAESFDEFLERVRRSYGQLRQGKGHAAVFSHGAFVRATMWLFGSAQGRRGSADMQQFRNLLVASPIPNAAIIEGHLTDTESSFGEPSVAHLSEITPDRTGPS